MRTLLILSFLVTISSFGQIKEEESIKKVIIDETESYSKQDIETWRNCLTKSSKMAYVYGMPDGSTGAVIGYENIEKMMLEFLKENSQSTYITKKREDWNIKINGDMAWATYKEISVIDGQESEAQEIRVLEKIDGNWKLGLISFIY